MAIWEFSFYIIPRFRRLENNNKGYIFSWLGEQIKVDPNLFFRGTLNRKDSWCNDIKLFGDDEGTCIKFFVEHENIEEISCRLDLRTLCKYELDKILEYIKLIDGKIFYENKIYEADISEVTRLIKSSVAYKFCKDPRGFFEELSSSNI